MCPQEIDLFIDVSYMNTVSLQETTLVTELIAVPWYRTNKNIIIIIITIAHFKIHQ